MSNAMASPAAALGLKEILVTTDFSPAANAAVRFAAELAGKHNARLHLAHVVWMRPYDATPDVSSPTLCWMLRVGQEQLDAVDHSALLAGLAHQAHLLQGRPELVLPEFVAEEKIDLAVVGASGRNGVGRLILGSTSENILRSLPCPVLTVGPNAWHTRHGSEFYSILAACGLGDASERVAEYAGRLAQEYRAQLTLMHAIPPQHAGDTSRYEAAERSLGALKPGGVCFWTPPEIRLDVGPPADCILTAAGELKADLIVMGARGSAGMTDHLSTLTHRIVCDAPCPVLTLRG